MELCQSPEVMKEPVQYEQQNIFVIFPLAIVQVIHGQGDKGNLQTNAGEPLPCHHYCQPRGRTASDISQVSEYKVDQCNISYSQASGENGIKRSLEHACHI